MNSYSESCINLWFFFFFFAELEDLLQQKPVSTTTDIINDFTPSNSDMSSPERSPGSSPGDICFSDQDSPRYIGSTEKSNVGPYSITLIQDKEDSSDSFLTRGMMDRTRIMLCMFVFGILAFNPFSYFLNVAGGGLGFDDSTGHTGRVILSEDAAGEGNILALVSIINHTVNLYNILQLNPSALIYSIRYNSGMAMSSIVL